ncbi:phage antirepressor N-terminal domain-containing protein [Mannheimia haemolytica]|nr:phage antirepressor N-terminal domain-containing protein [Mannheimia haemolytica]
MSNQITTQTISFHGSELITLKINDVIYTAVKPIVEALGLSWGTQKRKLIEQQEKFSWVHMNSTGSDGKTYEMLCMPIKKLNGWLFSINPEKVRADLKEKVICYQEECFEALYNYWHFGKAERQIEQTLLSPYINEHEQRQVQEAVNRAVKRTGRDYNNVYHHLKTKFNVAKYTQLKPEQMRDVLIYLAGMPIKQVPSEFETVGFPAQSIVRINDVLPVAIFYRDVGKMIKELGAICEELSKSRKSELVAILKSYCDSFGERSALVRKVRGVLIAQLGQLPQDDQDYLRDFIEL